MNKTERRIETLEAQISELQGQLSVAQENLRRRNFKRARKAYRKKFRTSITLQMMARIEKDMFRGCLFPIPKIYGSLMNWGI